MTLKIVLAHLLISSFEMTKSILFSSLTTLHPSIFFFFIVLFIAKADAIATNFAKTILAKGTATFINGPVIFSNNALKLKYFRKLYFTEFYVCRHIVRESTP